jgi:protein ImuB
VFDSPIMVACALIPRLQLTSALGDQRRALLAQPVALAPEPGGVQVVGEASGAAEAFGVRAGMRIGEALSRCPGLTLVAPDPVSSALAWERSLRALESMGAAVEPARAGEAYFATEPLRALCGGPEAVLARARRALGSGVRVGAGPNRLAARAAARRMRAKRPPLVLSEQVATRLLAKLPVGDLYGQVARGSASTDRVAPGREAEEATLIHSLERLGVGTLGELAALPAAAVADRFGELGLRALRLARGADEPLRPRSRPEELETKLGLPEAASGQLLERALALLVERLLAHPARRGRTIRKLRIEARLAAGGGWRCEVTMRSASTNSERLLTALAPRLSELPGPAAWIGLRALDLGPEAGEQGTLARTPADGRRQRLSEAVQQVRSAAGRDAVLRVLEVDPTSRVPERRAILTPFGPERDGRE